MVVKSETNLSPVLPFGTVSHGLSSSPCRNGIMVQQCNSQTDFSAGNIFRSKSVKKLTSSVVKRKNILGFKSFSYCVNLSNFQAVLVTNP